MASDSRTLLLDTLTATSSQVVSSVIEVNRAAVTAVTPPAPDATGSDSSSPSRAELERQVEQLSVLAGTIAHDLQDPLRAAQTNLEMARHDDDPELLEAVARSHDRMETLLSDLQTLARQGEAVVDPELVSVPSVADDAWDLVDTADATLVTTPVSVEADRTRLRQLLQNLFRNAIQHGAVDDGTASAVTVTVGPTDEGFFVADDGPGIPAADRESVFEYGYSTAESNSGFGLAIVRVIADAHDWTVTVTESADGGARFEFDTAP